MRFFRDVQHLTRIRLMQYAVWCFCDIRAFSVHETMSPDDQIRVRTIQSKVNKGQLSNFTSRGLADPDDDVVCTMQRRCCLHHVAILWTSSAQHDNVIGTARRRRTRKPTMSCRAEVFRCMTLHKILHMGWDSL